MPILPQIPAMSSNWGVNHPFSPVRHPSSYYPQPASVAVIPTPSQYLTPFNPVYDLVGNRLPGYTTDNMASLQGEKIANSTAIAAAGANEMVTDREVPLTLIQGMRYLKSLAISDNKPSIFSAFSLISALMTVRLGAAGKTFDEINSYLGAMDYDMMLRVTQQLASSGTIKNLNFLMLRQGYTFKTDFVEAANKSNTLSNFDPSRPDVVVSGINSMVNTETKGMIPQTMKNGDIDSLTVAIIMNVLYFKDSWKYKFAPEDVKPRDFTGNGVVRKIPTMVKCGTYYNYTDLKGGKLIELPYKSSAAVFGIYLPKEGESPESITATELFNGVKRLQEYEVSILQVPVFSIESTHELIPYLQSSGVTSIFNRDLADLTKMCVDRTFISRAFQKAKIEVDTEGTKAAAATVMIAALAMAMPPMYERPTKEFIANRNFLYYIRYPPTQTFLFMGKYC